MSLFVYTECSSVPFLLVFTEKQASVYNILGIYHVENTNIHIYMQGS